jgi:hypothetical protein
MYIPLSRRKQFQDSVKQSIKDGIPISGDLPMKNPKYLAELAEEAKKEKKNE